LATEGTENTEVLAANNANNTKVKKLIKFAGNKNFITNRFLRFLRYLRLKPVLSEAEGQFLFSSSPLEPRPSPLVAKSDRLL
jgi:hypothetical protein